MIFYNEFDPAAAAWLRELIARKLIPAGVVDERSISDLKPSDLHGYAQCHFFAGIGGWPLALELAGVDPARPLWTGSCPCQPYSAAGKGLGDEDHRNLWPAFFRLIRECRPELVFGEQVESAIGHGWLDGVSADLESEDYTCGASVLGAHSVGAPHVRQRLYWVASTSGDRREVALLDAGSRDASDRVGEADQPRGNRPHMLGLADSISPGLEGHRRDERDRDQPGRLDPLTAGSVAAGGAVGGMGDGTSRGLAVIGDAARAGSGGHADGAGGASCGMAKSRSLRHGERDFGAVRGTGSGDEGEEPESRGTSSEAINYRATGFWRDSYWLPCRDGKHRRVPTQPALFPLADGLPYKLARRGSIRPAILKGAGNAIVPQVAAEFIAAYFDTLTP